MAICKLACIENPSMKLCIRDDCESEVVTGEYAGIKLREYIERKGKEILGEHMKDFTGFPYMISWENPQTPVLSDPQKAKLWLVLHHQEGARLYIGAKTFIPLNWENCSEMLDELNAVTTFDEEAFYIQPGILAAIGEGMQVLNVEQEAGLRGGNAVGCKVMNQPDKGPYIEDGSSQSEEICLCDAFAVYKTRVDGRVEFDCDEESFGTLVMIEGRAIVECDGESLHVNRGDTVFMDARTYDIKVTGNCTYVFVRM